MLRYTKAMDYMKIKTFKNQKQFKIIKKLNDF